MKYKIYCSLILVIILLGMENHRTYANDWNDEDTPISYKIEMLPWEEVDKHSTEIL